MYRFYERAHICYAYLRDVSLDDLHDSFVKSEWFSRGWTLQELLAPTDLRFYDRHWRLLGDKTSLSHLISAATGIQDDVLTGKRRLQECSVAQRMSWAARRVTSRVEDRAYSLLGIFDVNMTMLYGEGPKSFLRLQEEIIKNLDDHSIFVWEGLQPGLPGLLASSPSAFASSGDVRSTRGRNGRHPYSMNNRGLYGLVTLVPYTLDTYVTLLTCTHFNATGQSGAVGLFLRRLHDDDQFMRVSVHGKELIRDGAAWLRQRGVDGVCLSRDISIRQSPSLLHEMEDAYIDRIQGFRLNRELLEADSTVDQPFSISGAWDSETRIVSLSPGSRKIHHVGAIDLGSQERVIEVVRFGFDYDYNPVIYLTQKGVRYSEREDERGVFVESFRGRSESGKFWGGRFMNGSPAALTHKSQCEELPEGILVAYMSEDVDGLWALQADRLDGLDVYVTDAAGQLAEDSREDYVGRVRLQRVIVDERLVWDLQLNELAPRRRHPRSENVQGKRKRSEDDEWERYFGI